MRVRTVSSLPAEMTACWCARDAPAEGRPKVHRQIGSLSLRSGRAHPPPRRSLLCRPRRQWRPANGEATEAAFSQPSVTGAQSSQSGTRTTNVVQHGGEGRTSVDTAGGNNLDRLACEWALVLPAHIDQLRDQQGRRRSASVTTALL